MANGCHKRDTNARKLPRASLIAGPVALLFTAPAVGVGVLTAGPAATNLTADPRVPAADLDEFARTDISRSGARGGGPATVDMTAADRWKAEAARRAKRERAELRATQLAVRKADTRLWTTEDLNLWTEPTKAADRLGVLDSGVKVLVTERKEAGRAEVVVDGKARWVTQGYFSDEKPVVGIGGACTNGTSVASGVSSNIAKVHQAVCAAFPSISTYGTLRGGGGDHSVGRAVDIMVSGSLGYEVAEFVRANYAELGVSYIIYSQRIWSVERSGEGWRGMSDRGSSTANHYDHVHVSTY